MEDWAFQENYWEDGLPPLKTLDHQRRVAIREQKRKEVVVWPCEVKNRSAFLHPDPLAVIPTARW